MQERTLALVADLEARGNPDGDPDGSPGGNGTRHRTWAERELLRLNRALRVLSACNRAVGASRDESDLLQQVCRIVVEVGGYGAVWVS